MGAATGGGDFMSDLFNKLAMRRKGEDGLYLRHVRFRVLMGMFGSAYSKQCVPFSLQAYLEKFQPVGSRVTLPPVPAVLLPGCPTSSHHFLLHSRQQMTTTGKHNTSDS